MKILKYYSAHFLPLDNLGAVPQHGVLLGDVSVPVLDDGLLHFEGDLGERTIRDGVPRLTENRVKSWHGKVA